MLGELKMLGLEVVGVRMLREFRVEGIQPTPTRAKKARKFVKPHFCITL